MIQDLHVGMRVRWANEDDMNRIVPGKRTGTIEEIAEHKPTGMPVVSIKFDDGSRAGMFAWKCRLQMKAL